MKSLMFSVQKSLRSKQLVPIGMMFTSLLLFLTSAEISIAAKSNPIDDSLFLFCHSFTNQFTIRIALFFSFFGTGAFLIPAYILIVHFLNKLNHEKYAALVVTIVVTSLLSGWLLKLIFHRHRPAVPLVHGAGWYSFPSGHALGTFTFSGICLFLLWKSRMSVSNKRLLSGVFIFLGCSVGLSRVFLHVHFATDVRGSLFFSIFWIVFVYMIFQIVYRSELHKKKERIRDFNNMLRGNN
jgi:undecaprenyl-diphosphatase